MSLFEYRGDICIFTLVRIKETLLYHYHTNHVGIMSKDDIHHKCAHPADNARPIVLSNAVCDTGLSPMHSAGCMLAVGFRANKECLKLLPIFWCFGVWCGVEWPVYWKLFILACFFVAFCWKLTVKDSAHIWFEMFSHTECRITSPQKIKTVI